MSHPPIQSLSNLNRLRTAPSLTLSEKNLLKSELILEMANYSWFTIGVMASSNVLALQSYRELEVSQGWETLPLAATTEDSGPVYLKANQKTRSVRIRIEHGLGSGILISGHGQNDEQAVTIWGPLPLDFFA